MQIDSQVCMAALRLSHVALDEAQFLTHLGDFLQTVLH